jgi:hypothetical protein
MCKIFLMTTAFLLLGFRQEPSSGVESQVLEITSRLTSMDVHTGGNASESRPSLQLSIRNATSKCVRGYVIKIRFANAAGKPMFGRSRMKLRLANNGTLGCLNPAETEEWPNNLQLPLDSEGNPAKYTVSVDVVVFDDESTWGPATSEQAQKLIGMIQGMDLIRKQQR